MILHKETNSLVFKANDPFLVRERITNSKVIDHADYNVAVRITPEAVSILQNMGFEVPDDLLQGLKEYTWPGKYKPFAHQKIMADFLVKNKRCFNLSEMGVGKSAAALWAADYLMTKGLVRRALILSPLSTLERVWRQDIYDVLMHRRAAVLHGTREKRMAAFNQDVDFYILNHDGVGIPAMRDAIRNREDIDLVILDEASMFRNSGTMRYKSLTKMLRPDVRLWLLTGTPCPNAPTDAWALARLVDTQRVPPFFGAFRRQTMLEMGRFKWMPKPDAYITAYEAMQPAVRFKKADCLDLPPVMTQDWEADMTQEQKQAFTTMRNEMIAEAKEKEITAVNAADRINKLRQILCGVIKDPASDTYITIPHKLRTNVLLEAIQMATAKVIVIVPFKGILRELEKEISEHYSVGVLNGDVTPKKRNEIIEAFKQAKDPHVLLCHPQVMSHGLNLTEADTLVFYAPIYSNDQFQQVVERFNRQGQTRKMTVIRIGAHKLDWEIYKAVDTKRTTQDNILALYHSITSSGTHTNGHKRSDETIHRS